MNAAKLEQSGYKTRHDWVGKVIYKELRQKSIFDDTTNCYMHKPKSVLENETREIHWDFEIQTDHLIPARRSNLMIINKIKRTCCRVDFTAPADYGMKIKGSEKRGKYLGLHREVRKLRDMKVMVISIVIGALRTVPKRLVRGAWKIWKLEDESRLFKLHHCWDRPVYWEESWRPERLAVTQDSI